VRRSAVLLLVLLSACTANRFGPWLDPSGQPLEGSQVLEYAGFPECGHREVVFMMFFDRLFARDPEGVLGQLYNQAGDPLSFAVLAETPAGLTESGITHNDRQLLYDAANREDYVFVRLGDGTVERWPRAEIACDRPGAGVTAGG
jgi:hypothetical protein